MNHFLFLRTSIDFFSVVHKHVAIPSDPNKKKHSRFPSSLTYTSPFPWLLNFLKGLSSSSSGLSSPTLPRPPQATLWLPFPRELVGPELLLGPRQVRCLYHLCLPAAQGSSAPALPVQELPYPTLCCFSQHPESLLCARHLTRPLAASPCTTLTPTSDVGVVMS